MIYSIEEMNAVDKAVMFFYNARPVSYSDCRCDKKKKKEFPTLKSSSHQKIGPPRQSTCFWYVIRKKSKKCNESVKKIHPF